MRSRTPPTAASVHIRTSDEAPGEAHGDLRVYRLLRDTGCGHDDRGSDVKSPVFRGRLRHASSSSFAITDSRQRGAHCPELSQELVGMVTRTVTSRTAVS